MAAAPPSPTLAAVLEQTDERTFRLSDGRTLLSPRPAGEQDVAIGSWISVDGWPYEITNMLWRPSGGRILHLNGGPSILSMKPHQTVEKFTVLTIPTRR
ncbi:hypothetical protein ACFV4M_25830 [Kitasatospora indigofera]|uniref:hypothetical protein n=1 Tax=Kitasatospora indigofera TaxID=67307 RepID=UPI0036673415